MTRPYYDTQEITSALDGLDHVAGDMERKWGVGRLRLLVGDELRCKFDRQAALLDKFLWDDQQPCREVVGKVQAMKRAWLALDQAAASTGASTLPAAFLECPLPDGGTIAIVSEDSGGEIPADGRRVTVYSTAEIGRMVAAAASILTVKREFPGAVVERVRVKRPTWHSDGLEGLLT